MAHLTLDQRIVISRMRRAGETQKETAIAIGCSPSTISRELKRNRRPKEIYRADIANRLASDRKKTPSVLSKLEEPNLFRAVAEKLKLNWSPEQISRWLALHSRDLRISHQTIYRFLYALDRKHPFRLAMRRGGRRKRKAIPGFLKPRADRVSIHARPKAVEKRNRIGHWEMDLMTCHRSSGHLVTAVERKTGFTLIGRVPFKRSGMVMHRILEMFKGIAPAKIKSMTFDNGTEFFYHRMLTQSLNVKVYFADPYKSYQRGTNENTNGLIRQYFPKTLDYGYISWQQVVKVQQLLNTRPRLRLRFQTPASQFN